MTNGDSHAWAEGRGGRIGAARVPGRAAGPRGCVLIVDGTTDERFLERTLSDVWAELSAGSPNHGRSRDELTSLRFERGGASVRWFVRRLCEAAA